VMNTEDLASLKAQISVYPVIVNNYINVHCSNSEIEIKRIEILTLGGKKIQSFLLEDSKNNHAELNLDGVHSTGYHFMIIRTSNGSVTKKFFKR